MMTLILPRSTLDLIEAVQPEDRHPGLQLDKLSVPGDQTAQKRALEDVCRSLGDDNLLEAMGNRRQQMLHALPGFCTFSCKTIAPLTLHLSRASALENAGICLHPIYGFAYLPGSGLKGMARAYAETVWLPAQTDQKHAWRQIEDVFGWAPNPDRIRQVKDPAHPAHIRRQNENDPKSPEIKASSGNIVFHDAWPESWPALFVDIVNNHHPEYYQAEPDDNAHPPGDWENPVPVYFLAVRPGVTFTFALTKRHADVPNELVELARLWLLGALCHLGAGAKTAAGYGAFQPVNGTAPSLPQGKLEIFEVELELVTPAFLAGANQQQDDCELRPATLRGLLRWWWRTLHAGFVDVKTLRPLEAAIWGDTNTGGAVRIELTTIQPGTQRMHQHPQERNSGIRYLAYGMDEKTSRGQRRQRFRLDPPAKWKLRLIVRPSQFNGVSISSRQVLLQAQAALALLCSYGGVGSKSRKGFGSLAAITNNGLPNLEQCQQWSSQLRQDCKLNDKFIEKINESYAIFDPDKQSVADLPCQAASWQEVMERVGQAYAAIATRFKHNVDQDGKIRSPDKTAFGLPRKIHGPMDRPLRHQSPDTHRPPRWLDFPKRPRTISPQNARHASPIHIHIAKNGDSGFVVRVLAMPAKYLPNRTVSIQMLQAFCEAFEQAFNSARPQVSLNRGPSGPSGVRSPAVGTSGPTPVQVTFLGPHEKVNHFYWVQEQGKNRGLVKYGEPPTPLPAVGSIITVYPTNTNPNSPEYRWDPPPPPSTPSARPSSRPPLPPPRGGPRRN